MSSNSDNKKSAFSQNFCRAVAKAVPKDGTSVSASRVAMLIKDQFEASTLTLLEVMVGEAVRDGCVPGCSATRGRNGGLYKVQARSKRQQASA